MIKCALNVLCVLSGTYGHIQDIRKGILKKTFFPKEYDLIKVNELSKKHCFLSMFSARVTFT